MSHPFTQLHLCSFCEKLLGESAGIINFDHMQGKLKVIRVGGRCKPPSGWSGWFEVHIRLLTEAISAESRALRVPFEERPVQPVQPKAIKLGGYFWGWLYAGFLQVSRFIFSTRLGLHTNGLCDLPAHKQDIASIFNAHNQAE